MNDKTNLVTKEESKELAAPLPANESAAMLQIISTAAMNPEVDIDKMERMMVMHEKLLNRDAQMAYNSAMSKLQSELPTITENGQIEVNKVIRSKYAKFEDINEAIRPLLKKHGFSVSFKSDFVEQMLDVTGIISHKQGHSEQTTMRLPFDTSGSKNNVQAIGSSVSYGKRYCVCMLLNIATGGEDNDGNTMPETPLFVTEKDIKQLIGAAKSVGQDEKYICKKANIPSIDKLLVSRYAPCMNHLQSLMEK